MLEGICSGDLCEGLLGGTRGKGFFAVGEGVVEVLGFLVLVLAKRRSGGLVRIPLAAVAEVASAGCPLLANLLGTGRTSTMNMRMSDWMNI